jgi:hypothetical protein
MPFKSFVPEQFFVFVFMFATHAANVFEETFFAWYITGSGSEKATGAGWW